MKCFNHSTAEAVAVCKSCGRALCHDCTTEVGLSCSCKNRCESVVATANDLMERGRTAYQKTSGLQYRNGIFIILLGVTFLAGVASAFPEVSGASGPTSFLREARFLQAWDFRA